MAEVSLIHCVLGIQCGVDIGGMVFADMYVWIVRATGGASAK